MTTQPYRFPRVGFAILIFGAGLWTLSMMMPLYHGEFMTPGGVLTVYGIQWLIYSFLAPVMSHPTPALIATAVSHVILWSAMITLWFSRAENRPAWAACHCILLFVCAGAAIVITSNELASNDGLRFGLAVWSCGLFAVAVGLAVLGVPARLGHD